MSDVPVLAAAARTAAEVEAALRLSEYYPGPLCGAPRPHSRQADPRVLLCADTGAVPEYSLVVPVHDQEAAIAYNLAALLRHTVGAFELIVVVDSSRRRTASRRRRCPSPSSCRRTAR
jgi:hypothetical protein